jgi:hypothetical protein
MAHLCPTDPQALARKEPIAGFDPALASRALSINVFSATVRDRTPVARLPGRSSREARAKAGLPPVARSRMQASEGWWT